jgi:hypothetical protein
VITPTKALTSKNLASRNLLKKPKHNLFFYYQLDHRLSPIPHEINRDVWPYELERSRRFHDEAYCFLYYTLDVIAFLSILQSPHYGRFAVHIPWIPFNVAECLPARTGVPTPTRSATWEGGDPLLKKNRQPPSPLPYPPQKNWSDRSFSKSVGASSFVPVPGHTFPLEFQMSGGGRPDRIHGSVGPTDRTHWSGRPVIHADLREPPSPLPPAPQENRSVRPIITRGHPHPHFFGIRQTRTFQKTLGRELKICRKDRIASRQFTKKFDAVAEDSKKKRFGWARAREVPPSAPVPGCCLFFARDRLKKRILIPITQYT